jgi:hypothetical protein
MNEALCKVIKRLHYPLAVMLTCVRWYVAYPLSLCHIEELMAERGVMVDHATVHHARFLISRYHQAVSNGLSPPSITSDVAPFFRVDAGGGSVSPYLVLTTEGPGSNS